MFIPMWSLNLEAIVPTAAVRCGYRALMAGSSLGDVGLEEPLHRSRMRTLSNNRKGRGITLLLLLLVGWK